MTKVTKPDQHMATYIYAKQVKPDAKFVWRAYEKDVVDTVDKIVELAHGERDEIRTESDWKVFEEILSFFAKKWTDEFKQFIEGISGIRQTRRSGGYSQSKEIKYVGAIPPRLERMVKAIFPSQEWNKKFVNKLVKKYPIFKVGGEQNL